MKWKPKGRQSDPRLIKYNRLHCAAGGNLPSNTVRVASFNLMHLWSSILHTIWQTGHAGCRLNLTVLPGLNSTLSLFCSATLKTISTSLVLCLCLFICAWNCMYSLCIVFFVTPLAYLFIPLSTHLLAQSVVYGNDIY